MMLYEMLTGHSPFRARSEYDLMMAHLEKPPTPLRKLLPEISDRIEQVVMRALAKEPGRTTAVGGGSSARRFMPHWSSVRHHLGFNARRRNSVCGESRLVSGFVVRDR